MTKEKISVIGLGFVGLSVAVVNAMKGFHTLGIDIDDVKIKNLQQGKVSFFEPKLEKSLKSVLSSKKIEFSNDFMKILDSDITFLTVGTPPKKSGDVDLSSIKSALSKISKVLESKEKYHLLVVKSTLSPETTNKLIIPKFEKQISLNKMDVVVNPEFLQEGVAINDILDPHIIVIGGYNKKGIKFLIKYYKNFYKKLPEIIQVGITTAELIKYANNSFLATKISFINSIANICQKLPDVDVDSISYAIGKDNRIGPLFLQAGPGFGGSCLPKDLSGLISFSKKIGNPSPFFEAVENVNASQPKQIFTIMKNMKILSPKKTISILGLSFKKNTDDIRESVSIKIVRKCLNYGLKIKVHDSMAITNFKKIFNDNIEYCKSIDSCLKNSDCCIILTDSDEYKKLKLHNFSNMNKKNIIDTRRILNHKNFKNTNFYALGLGQFK